MICKMDLHFNKTKQMESSFINDVGSFEFKKKLCVCVCLVNIKARI